MHDNAPFVWHRNIGLILTAIWLILTGLGQLGVSTVSGTILGIIALLAGIFLIVGR